MGRLDEKVAIITGAGTGLGRSAAIYFAREGATVVGCGRTEATLAEMVARCTEAGGTASYVIGDVADSGDVDRIVRATLERHGRIDALVNNAGVLMSRREAQAGSLGSTLEVHDDDWDQVLDINLHGVFLMCRRVIPHMREHGGGAILNVA